MKKLLLATIALLLSPAIACAGAALMTAAQPAGGSVIVRVTPVLAAGERGGLIICGNGPESFTAIALGDDDMEDDDSSWLDDSLDGGETQAQSAAQKHGGSNSRFIDQADDNEGMYQVFGSHTSGDLFQVEAWAYSTSGNTRTRLWDGATACINATHTIHGTATWVKCLSRGTSANTGNHQLMMEVSSADSQIYYDDISINKINAPLTALICEIDRTQDLLILTKRVAGTETVLISESITYADNHELVVVKEGQSVVVFYTDAGDNDNIQIGATQTVTETYGRRHYTTGDDSSFTGYSHKMLAIGIDKISTWANISFDTFTSSGTAITSAIDTEPAGGYAAAEATLSAGSIYRIEVVLTLNSGDSPDVMVGSGQENMTRQNLSAGSNIYYFICVATSGNKDHLYYYSPVLSNFSSTHKMELVK